MRPFAKGSVFEVRELNLRLKEGVAGLDGDLKKNLQVELPLVHVSACVELKLLAVGQDGLSCFVSDFSDPHAGVRSAFPPDVAPYNYARRDAFL